MKTLILTLALLSTPAFAFDDQYSEFGAKEGDTFQLTYAGHHGPGLHCYVHRDGENTMVDSDLSRCRGQSTTMFSVIGDGSSYDGKTISIDEEGRIVTPNE